MVLTVLSFFFSFSIFNRGYSFVYCLDYRCTIVCVSRFLAEQRSVFVGADKETGEIVALKRINTEQEENGFPITAIREVKILKALNHVNIVKLKEIVTSKGALNHGARTAFVFVRLRSLCMKNFMRESVSRLSTMWRLLYRT